MKKIYFTHEEKLAARRARRRDNKGLTTFDYKWDWIKKTKGGCWEWLGQKWRTGYGYVRFREDGKVKTTAAHRYIYKIHKGEFNETLNVLHTCDNPSCVNPNHLWLGTHTDNMRDMVAKGRHVKRGQKRYE